MARNVMTVTVIGHFTYEAPCYGAPWKNERHHIWKMIDDAGNIFVWKTTNYLGMDVRIPDPNRPDDREYDRWDRVFAHKGDIVKITGTIKAITDYNGEQETALTRVKMLEKVFDAEAEREARKKAREAEKAARKEALLNSVTDGDEIITMDYKRYKAHYADCETVPDSYKDYVDYLGRRVKDPTIDVIVRAGRMVPSGVRGKNFKTYYVAFTIDGAPKCKAYYAVSYENAEKRCRKDFPNGTGFKFDHASHHSARWID